jgi:hypothetical protein
MAELIPATSLLSVMTEVITAVRILKDAEKSYFHPVNSLNLKF